MAGWPILSLTTFLPLVGAAFILLIRGEPDVVARNARNVALWTSLITFVLSLFIWLNFDNTTAAFQMVERADWIPAFKINYHMGVDGISVLFVLLSDLPDPALHPGELGVGEGPRQGIHDRLPGPRSPGLSACSARWTSCSSTSSSKAC